MGNRFQLIRVLLPLICILVVVSLLASNTIFKLEDTRASVVNTGQSRISWLPDNQDFPALSQIQIITDILQPNDNINHPKSTFISLYNELNSDNKSFLPLVFLQTQNIDYEPYDTYYVSKNGNNTDGRSWETAWNELDQILWGEIKPGDTILIDGGEYHSKLDVGRSGAPLAPITIMTNGEQVILDGQGAALPYCGQSEYTPKMSDDGIDLEGRSNIIIDGLDWSGIIIRRHHSGIRLREHANNIVIRNVEIYDNGWSTGSGLNREPDGPGIDLGGSNITFERVIIHDNGQDAFQAGWGIWNFTLRNSWLYNSREHPTIHGMSFNYCSHSDGLQIYDGGLQGPIIIENCIIGPSLTQGIIINVNAEVDDVIILNSLFVDNENAGIVISQGGYSSNWTVQNVTVVQDVFVDSWNINMRGGNHFIHRSIFLGGPWGIGVPDWLAVSDNYHWLTPDRYGVAIELNPMFLDDDFSGFQGAGFAEFDFVVQNPAIPSGTGSNITSVRQLLTSE